MAERSRPRKHVRLHEIASVDLAAIGGEALPVKVINISLGGDRRGVVFTMSASVREAHDRAWYVQLAQTLGNLVHPHPATIVVLPDGEDIHAYEAVAE